ncbi:MAG: TolC family protein [Verrucomicrobia subdivision 3 bacterium]|nr:TolC family protein [Limisphaerales bacterium]
MTQKIFLIAVAAASALAAAAGAAETNLLTLDSVITEVLAQNPALKSARANWQAMKERIPQARAWEDPMVGVDVERFGTTRFDAFTDNEWMIAQEIPVTGKNRLRGKSAFAEAIAAFEEFRRRELDVMAKARTAYYNLANAWEQLGINDRNIELLKQFVTVSRAKYESGTAPQSDVLIAETDLAKLQESRFDVLRDISDAESQLNVLMNRPARTPLGRPPTSAFFTLDLNEERFEALALERRPELLMAQKKIEAADARYKLARRDWIPDPEIRVEARQFNGRSGIQEYDTGIFFKFPWVNYRKYKAAIEEARQMKLSAEHELEGAQKETRGMIREQTKKVETFHHHTQLFRDKIVPLARQNIAATRSAYETERTGFLNLIDAQRTFYDVESMYWHHVTTYLTALAELEALVGADLNEQPKSPPTEKKDTP